MALDTETDELDELAIYLDELDAIVVDFIEDVVAGQYE